MPDDTTPPAVSIRRADTIACLFRRAQRNPERWFDQLYYDLWKDAYHIAYGILRNTQDAEDAAQAAFLKVHQNLSQLKDLQAAQKWFNRIVATQALNLIQTRKRQQHISDDIRVDADLSDFDQISASTLNFSGRTNSAATITATNTYAHHLPEELVLSKELASIVYSHIQQLPPKQREALLLYYYADFSVAEISDELSIPQGTVRSRLFNARETLHERLSQVEQTHGIRLYPATLLSLASLLETVSATIPAPPPPKIRGGGGVHTRNQQHGECVQTSTTQAPDPQTMDSLRTYCCGSNFCRYSHVFDPQASTASSWRRTGVPTSCKQHKPTSTQHQKYHKKGVFTATN